MIGAKRRTWHFILAGCVAAIVIVGAATIGLRAPVAAPAITLVSLEGRKIPLADLRGKVVLINFWATDCVVCIKEMPAMADTYRKYQARGLDAIFIAMPYDRPDRVLHYTRSAALPFHVALDVQAEAVRAFGGIRGTPTTLLIDKRGHIVERILGEPHFGRLHALIERKLDERV